MISNFSLVQATQAFLRTLLGSDAKLPLWFISEMPKPETNLKLDFASILGPLFYIWVIQLLFPVITWFPLLILIYPLCRYILGNIWLLLLIQVILTALVYEKQYNLRIMMKMHGLGDGPYWLISYCYFLALSMLYVFLFVFFGSVIGE